MLAEKVITRQSIKPALIFRLRPTPSRLLAYALLDASAGSTLDAQFLLPSHGVTNTMHSTYLQL